MPARIKIPAEAMEQYKKLKSDPAVKAVEQFIGHGGISIYEHSLSVARAAVSIANLFRVKPEKYVAIVTAGLLHDFYLYDYHGQRTKLGGWHAWRHPAVALDNARRLYDITPRQADAIRNHMFPGTLFHMPHYAEGWAIVLADKICSVFEYLGIRHYLDARLVPA